jgi:hypothetical protein
VFYTLIVVLLGCAFINFQCKKDFLHKSVANEEPQETCPSVKGVAAHGNQKVLALDVLHSKHGIKQHPSIINRPPQPQQLQPPPPQQPLN